MHGPHIKLCFDFTIAFTQLLSSLFAADFVCFDVLAFAMASDNDEPEIQVVSK